MAVAERGAQTIWTGTTARGSGRLRVDSGAFPEQTLTFAARTEQSDGKTSPEELIAAAHSACFAMALSAQLTRRGHPPEELVVRAVCTLDRVEGGYAITTMELEVRGRVSGRRRRGVSGSRARRRARLPGFQGVERQRRDQRTGHLDQ